MLLHTLICFVLEQGHSLSLSQKHAILFKKELFYCYFFFVVVVYHNKVSLIPLLELNKLIICIVNVIHHSLS